MWLNPLQQCHHAFLDMATPMLPPQKVMQALQVVHTVEVACTVTAVLTVLTSKHLNSAQLGAASDFVT